MKISIFDNVVPFVNRSTIYNDCISSNLKLGWTDRYEPEKYDLNLHSCWSKEDCEKSSILSFVEDCISTVEWFNQTKFSNAFVNIISSNSVHYIHTHPNNKLALYYVNLDWQDGWYGETLFYDDINLNSIKFASPFVPGRIILFDGSIPHSIRPQSISAPKHRLTISLLFE